MADEKQAKLAERMTFVHEEDDLGDAAIFCGRYPRIPDHRPSQFELDLRDWGLIYGIAYGLARATEPKDSNDQVGERAYKVARASFARWNGGEIEDPRVVRDRAIRDVIAKFDEAESAAYREGRPGKIEQLMTADLREALGELDIVMGGEA